ncbi:MAG: PorT family protein [Cytophagales bacterium]|nr:MAG: PorT family protein [Cytophagales bacterium]
MKISKIVLFIVFSIPSYSQIGIGLKLGGESSFTTNDTRNIQFTESKNQISFYGGIVADFNLNKYLVLRTELNYSNKGFQVIKYIDKQSFDSKSTKFSSNWGENRTYLQLPIILNFKFVDNEKIKIYTGAGPYISYAISGKNWADLTLNDLGSVEYKLKSVSENHIFDTDATFDNLKDNRIDIGGILNLGIAFKIPKGEFFLETRYEHSVSDWYSFSIETPKTYSSVMNRGVTASFGFIFTIKNKRTYYSEEQETND